MVKDPVCGMEIDEKEAVGTSTYNGEIYYFCSIVCKTAFDRSPGLGTWGKIKRALKKFQEEWIEEPIGKVDSDNVGCHTPPEELRKRAAQRLGGRR